MANTLTQWPALKTIDLPYELNYQRAIWGKADGLGSDYRWLAATPEFTGLASNLADKLNFIEENNPLSSGYWLSLGDSYYAVRCYPSRAVDANGQTGFLEKQLLEYQAKSQPRALAMVTLLDELTHFDDQVWWDRQVELTWLGSDAFIELSDADCIPVTVSEQRLAQKIEQGCQALAKELSIDQLTLIYCALLEQQAAVVIPELAEPLSLNALSVLTLPFELDKANSLSIAGGWPSTQISNEFLQQEQPWQLILLNQQQVDQELSQSWSVNLHKPISDNPHYKQAKVIAEALLDNNPVWLTQGSRPSFPAKSALEANKSTVNDKADNEVVADQDAVSEVVSANSEAVTISRQSPTPSSGRSPTVPTEDGVALTLWGPSAAGKTLLLAQLYLETVAKSQDWQIFPTETSLQFIENMRQVMRLDNSFPNATPVGTAEHISYRFQNKVQDISALIHLEDRAGKDYEQLQQDSRERLNQAAGLVLLFDPLRDRAELESEFYRTLEHLLVLSGRDTEKDPRPVAVCISKSDIYIKKPEDLTRAIEYPDEFVRERIEDYLLRPLDHFCANYKLFPVSSVGVKINYGVVEPVVFYDDALTPRIGQGGEPFNLMAPFAWVLSEIKAQNSEALV